MKMAGYKVEDKFTSSISDSYDNDSDFIQNIVLSGHTSYASLMDLADSDNVSAFASIKDSCAGILQTATYSEFDQSNQSIMRAINWPGDSADDMHYYNAYRDIIPQLNQNGSFRTLNYVRRMIRMGTEADSDGNNWGA
jgi:hypothetical protein